MGVIVHVFYTLIEQLQQPGPSRQDVRFLEPDHLNPHGSYTVAPDGPLSKGESC